MVISFGNSEGRACTRRGCDAIGRNLVVMERGIVWLICAGDVLAYLSVFFKGMSDCMAVHVIETAWVAIENYECLLNII